MFVNFATLSGYFPALVFLIFAIFISIVLITLPALIQDRTRDKEKLAPYECGAPVSGDARGIFDSRFALIAMLFIIFDLEIVMIVPWAVALNKMSLVGFCVGFGFLLILGLALIYEWRKGALEWE